MWSLFVLVALAVGCSGQGTLGIPDNCERASCMAYVQWTPVDNDNVQFELEATALGWVAVGVSADQRMGGDGIDDVFACQRDSTNDIVYAEDTFNPTDQSTRANTRDSDQSGFQLISSSFSGGRISCTFIRSVLASNPDEDRNLNETAFILLAFGVARDGPDITLTAHNGASRRASAAQVTLTDAVPMPVGMLGIPPNCERASCMAYVQWTPVGSATVRFELEGEAEGWVAVGVSADRVMGGDGIDDVFACQRDGTTDTVYAEDTYNPQNQSPRGNTRDSDQSGFVQLSSSFSGGRISCSFVRSVVADNVVEDRNLNVAAYLLLAFGNARGGPNITLAGHNMASRRAADAQVTLTEPVPAGMLGIPPNCERASCMAYVQWTPVDNDNVQFELEATAAGWVAVGVSADQVMGGDGIDDVFACQRDATTDTVYAEDTFNPQNQAPRGNTRDSDQNGFLLISSSFSDGRISCTFIRSVLASNSDEDRNLTEAAFILLAFGDARGGPNITLAAHNGESRRASPAQVTLTDGVIPMPVGMLGIPPNCERDSTCMAYAQWAPIGTASIRFELLTTAPGWVAVGVSADRVMGGNGIDDVFACQRDSTTDTVYAEDTYNPQNQAPRGNTRDSNQNGFQLIGSTFSAGRIMCSFVRSVLADNPAEDRNLNVAAYLLLAFGDARGGPAITLAAHNGASRRASAAQVTLTDGVPMPVGMFGIPEGCPRATCTVYAQWTLVSSSTLEFELEAVTPGWVAFGVSADRVMGTDGIDDVFACQRDATSDIVYAQDTYNPQSPRGNIVDSDQAEFELISSSFTAGRIFCNFNRSVLANSLTEDRNLNEPSFLFLAFGDARGGPIINFPGHNPASRQASASQVTLTDGVSPAPPAAPMSPVGTFTLPAGCSRANCRIFAQWNLISDDTFEFQLEAAAAGWVALGVSADARMGVNGIDDVFACQRDSTTDTVYAEDTFNPTDQSTRANTRDSDQTGFQLTTGSFTNGRISCTFTRTFLGSNDAEDRDLSVPAFLLIASGGQRGGPNIALAVHGEREATPAQVTLTDAVIPMPVGMFGIPEGCSRANCTVYAQWTLVSSSTLEFELEAVTPGWVAFGVSADQVMGGNGIDDVFACQRDNTTDTVFAQDTYNPQSPRGNIVDSDQAGFELISSSFTAGRIFCNFNRSVLANSLTEDRNLNEPSFLFLAFGDTRGGPIINFPGHNQASRQASASQVTLTDGVSPAAPMSPVGTFAIPAGCSRTTCRIFAQWNLISADTFEFQLEAAAAGWVAIGVSADAMMGVNGIDDVFACQRDGTTDAVYAEDTFNPTDQSTRANTRDSDQTGFQMTTGSFTNGRISCTFTRTFLGSNDAEDRDLSVPAFLLIASGGQRGGPNIALTVHGEREATAQAVDLRAGGNVVAGCGAHPLIRVHGILMYLAWVWLVPTAYFFAASMRPAMPTGTWFQIHRALMLAAIVPSVIGFILIFVAFRTNNSRPGLITLGSDNPIGTTHYVFGIVIIFLQFLNPIISFCRCKPGGKFRWIFNLIHGNIIGWGVILLALVNVSLGLWRYSGLAYGQTDNSRYYPFWIWIAFLIVYTFWDSFLFIYSKWIGPRLDKMWKKGEKEYEMKPTNADSSDDKEEPPKKMPSKDAPIRYGFMIFNILLLVVPGLIIMLLIAIGCI